MKNAWKALVDWFEFGDLVPLLVVVSAVHYVAILDGKDPIYAAIAIGVLVDLGHYKTVRAAVRYTSKFWTGGATRWAIALGMTAISLNYHQRYYNDWWLSAPLPLLIAALAWLHKVDANVGKRKSEPEAKPKEEPAKPKPQEAKEQTESKPQIKMYFAECEEPGCDWRKIGYASERAAQNALNAHMRKHGGDR